MDSRARREETARIAERAAEWLIALEDGGAEERAAFSEWVAASPLHLKEFLLISALDSEVGRVDPARKVEVQEILANVSGNVLPIRNDDALGRSPLPAYPLDKTAGGNWSFARRWAAGVAAIGIAIALGWWAVSTADRSYETAVGEQRRIELSDGSIVQLNTGSEVKVAFSDAAREIRLVKGEALFKVERDGVRPFRVRSGSSVVQALGTEFNVLRRPSGTVVSVIEGKVRVYGTAPLNTGNGQPVTARTEASLTVGEEARIDGSGLVEKRQTGDLTSVAAWRVNRLVFRDDTLEDIAAEFNRYNRNAQIRVAADEVRNRRYTAVFDADDPGSLTEFLRQDGGLTVEDRGSEIVVSKAVR